jgi:putative transposase
MTIMCRVLEVSVSGYYAWWKREPSRHARSDAQLAQQVKTVFQDNRCVSGSPRLQRDFSADQPNRKWVADTTYIWTGEGWFYLAVVLDLFSRMVVGWSMAAIQDATLVVQALRMAIARRRPEAGLLHHTDRGSTYTSQEYQEPLNSSSASIIVQEDTLPYPT